MNISIRLLFLLIFCAFVLPKIFLKLYDQTHGKLQRMEDVYNKDYEKHRAKNTKNKQALSDFVDSFNFKDNKLEACIKESISTQFIHGNRKDFKIEHLDCSNRGIKSLKGISNLKNLKHLRLDYNNLSDISDLSLLNNLESLNLSNNKEINSVYYLENIFSLKQAVLPNNPRLSCRAIQRINEGIKRRHGDQYEVATGFCLGKRTSRINNLLEKEESGRYLSGKEKKELNDYKKNRKVLY